MKIDNDAHCALVEILEGNPWDVRWRLMEWLKTVKIEGYED